MCLHKIHVRPHWPCGHLTSQYMDTSVQSVRHRRHNITILAQHHLTLTSRKITDAINLWSSCAQGSNTTVLHVSNEHVPHRVGQSLFASDFHNGARYSRKSWGFSFLCTLLDSYICPNLIMCCNVMPFTVVLYHPLSLILKFHFGRLSILRMHTVCNDNGALE